MSQLFFLTLACVVGFVAAGPIIGPCCLKKTVGNVSYTIVEQTDTSEFDCLSNCVYEQDGVLGSRFCFAHGELPVVCNGIGIPHEAIFCGEDLKKLLDGFSEENTTASARCCTKDTISRCYGHNCTDICDVEVKCLKLVPYGDLSNDEHCRKDIEGRDFPPGPGVIDMVVAIEAGACAPTECPTWYHDPKSICCRDKTYDKGCNKCNPSTNEVVDNCKCMVTCDYMARQGICIGACSWCCSCENYRKACLNAGICAYSPKPDTDEPNTCSICPVDSTDTCCDNCNDDTYRTQTCPMQCKCNCFCNKIIDNKLLKYPPSGFNGCYPDWAACCDCPNTGNYNSICKPTCS